MVFAPVDAAIKEKIISAHLAGHGRNQIDRELREQGIKVSHGSISNFINAYKRKHEQPRPADTLTKSEPDFANTPYEQYPNTEPDASIISVKTKNSTIEEKDERCKNKPSPPLPTLENPSESNLGDSESNAKQSGGEAVSTNVSAQNTNISACKQASTTFRFIVDESTSTLLTQSYTNSPTKVGAPPQPETEAREKSETRTNWRELAEDPNGGWTLRTIILEMNKEKALRKRQLEQIDHRRRVLERKEEQLRHEREYIENSRNDLAVRESRVIAVEPLLPLARQLWESKIGFDLLLPWIETVREKAQTENVSMDIAAISVAQEIRNYRHVGGVSKCLQQIQNQILILDTLYMHKQQAIGILMDLQSRGISEMEIVRLVNLAGEWNKYWQSSKTNVNGNLQQPVNDSSNPGGSGGNGYGDNLSINDLIRLNLLKSTTTNLLSQMSHTDYRILSLV